jgi:putative transposase
MAIVTHATSEPVSGQIDLDELARLAARDYIAVALEAERRAYLEAHAHLLDEDGHRLVVGHGYGRPRQVVTAAGAIEVEAPRVRDRRAGERFSSALLPPYLRRSPKVGAVLPLLYLHGLSSGDFEPALREFFGAESALSASTITRLTTSWRAEYAEWEQRDLSTVDYVYWWVDGVHTRVRLEEDRLCCLVIVGVRIDGTKELVAVRDGYRESKQSWAELLRDLKRRGLASPALAVGDGALGFWAALRDVYPTTREQRCWLHRTLNVLDALPDRLQQRAKAALHRIADAEGREAALDAVHAFAAQFADYPKATAKITEELDTLFAFYDFPREHWIHLRTINPIESTFATVRLRQRVTKGPGSREAGLTMVYKLMRVAEERWRKVNAPHLVALVRAGAVFVDGRLSEGSGERAA